MQEKAWSTGGLKKFINKITDNIVHEMLIDSNTIVIETKKPIDIITGIIVYDSANGYAYILRYDNATFSMVFNEVINFTIDNMPNSIVYTRANNTDIYDTKLQNVSVNQYIAETNSYRTQIVIRENAIPLEDLYIYYTTTKITYRN